MSDGAVGSRCHPEPRAHVTPFVSIRVLRGEHCPRPCFSDGETSTDISSPRSARTRRCRESGSRSLQPCVRFTSLLRRVGSSVLVWTRSGHSPCAGDDVPLGNGQKDTLPLASPVRLSQPRGKRRLLCSGCPLTWPSFRNTLTDTPRRRLTNYRGPRHLLRGRADHVLREGTDTWEALWAQRMRMCRGQKRGADHTREKKKKMSRTWPWNPERPDLHTALHPGELPSRAPNAPGVSLGVSFLRCAVEPSGALCRRDGSPTAGCVSANSQSAVYPRGTKVRV